MRSFQIRKGGPVMNESHLEWLWKFLTMSVPRPDGVVIRRCRLGVVWFCSGVYEGTRWFSLGLCQNDGTGMRSILRTKDLRFARSMFRSVVHVKSGEKGRPATKAYLALLESGKLGKASFDH